MEFSEEIRQRLLAPLPPECEEFLPRGGGSKGPKGTPARTQGLVYFGAESVIERLNSVVGPAGWSFSVEVVRTDPVAVYGRLTVLGHTHEDFGEASSEGEPLKAARTDALKRCGRNFGIGLYLWFFPKDTWGEHDGWKWTKPPEVAPALRAHALCLAGYTGTPPAATQQTQQRPPESRGDQRARQAVQSAERPLEGHSRPPAATAGGARPASAAAATAPGNGRETPALPMTRTTPSGAGSSDPAVLLCSDERCAVILTKGQFDVSNRAYGKPLCPSCQRKARGEDPVPGAFK